MTRPTSPSERRGAPEASGAVSRLLTLDDVAQALRVSRRSVERLVAAGRLRARKGRRPGKAQAA